MIIMRLETIGGKYTNIIGGKRIQAKFRYDDDSVGWFPVESAGFGFKAASEAGVGGSNGQTPTGQGARGATGGAAGGGAAARAPAAAAIGGANKEGEAFSQLSIARFVDRATVPLMFQAMVDRNIKKNEDEQMYKADVHFIHSVHAYATDGKESETDMFVYPYLQITLDRVLMRGWNISASGDDRPQENFELYFDKAAISYYRTEDGKHWNTIEPRGWDQTAQEPWDGGGSAFFKDPQ